MASRKRYLNLAILYGVILLLARTYTNVVSYIGYGNIGVIKNIIYEIFPFIGIIICIIFSKLNINSNNNRNTMIRTIICMTFNAFDVLNILSSYSYFRLVLSKGINTFFKLYNIITWALDNVMYLVSLLMVITGIEILISLNKKYNAMDINTDTELKEDKL